MENENPISPIFIQTDAFKFEYKDSRFDKIIELSDELKRLVREEIEFLENSVQPELDDTIQHLSAERDQLEFASEEDYDKAEDEVSKELAKYTAVEDVIELLKTPGFIYKI